MAFGSGIETVVGVGLELSPSYGTRATPGRFFELLPPIGLSFERNFYVSPALGGGLWTRKRVQTTRRGGGSLRLEVPTNGFGYLLRFLHNETITPSQIGSSIAYRQTHELISPPNRSATIQIQVPQEDGGGNTPFDYVGCTFTGAEFSWEPDGVLIAEFQTVVRDLLTDQTNATPGTVPDGLFSFKDGSLEIDGSPVADIVGGGSFSLGWPMRDDAYEFGQDGVIKEPRLNGKPSFTGQVTADFTSLSNYNRVVNDTIADVVLTFEGATIAGSTEYTFKITIPDCGFTGSPPSVTDAGPVQEQISFESASAGGDAPEFEYISTDTIA